ncbi:MAG: GIY-YIG nuclease family protein [Akkermansiaceae bacterium]
MAEKTYIVYLLKNRMNRRFTGITNDAEAELKAHNSGQFKGTKQFKPWQLEWYSEPLSRNDSLRLEEQLRLHKKSTSMLEQITKKQDMGL